MKKKTISLMIIGFMIFGIISGCSSNEVKNSSDNRSTESSENMTEEEKAHREEIKAQEKYDLENKTSSSSNSSASTSKDSIPDEIIIKDEGFITNLDKIFDNVNLYVGKKITVEGFVRNINGKNFSVLRYYDMPHEDHKDEVTVGINISYDGEMPNTDDWVVVTGTIESEKYDGSVQPIIKASKVQKQFTWGQKKVTN